ncbi:magnesium transporter [Candidatus Contubernalis alkalaceticus]|nr:magnesium transporter [Candidatus Contubernalis alkalaceticus]UNC91359.1 magnesium transporter [Candidatus Contubernalis alkalaceticus]
MGQIDGKSIWTFLGKETLIGFAIGALSGSAAALIAYFWQREPLISLVVFLSMTLTCTLASTIGYLIPMLSHKYGFDPAASSNPLITTIKDISGLLIYFSLANFSLQQLL